MKLSYRGVSYDYNPSNTIKAEYPSVAANLKYRGASYRRGEVAKVERLGAIFKYRGVEYTQTPIAQPEPVATPVAAVVPAAPEPAVMTLEDRARMLTMNHNRFVRNRQHAVLARTAAEVGFSAKLADYWNQVQGEIDTALWSEYDRSNAALS